MSRVTVLVADVILSATYSLSSQHTQCSYCTPTGKIKWKRSGLRGGQGILQNFTIILQ